MEQVPRIRLDDVTMRFGGLDAVRNCSFDLPAGRITGLIGPNGAGKTTAFNVIAGLLSPTLGRVVLDGEDITDLPAYRRQEKGLSRTFQLAHEFGRMTVIENLMVAAKNDVGEGIVNAVFRPSRCLSQEREAYDKALKTLEFLEISQLAGEPAGNLSGGQKKLLELGRALMQEPKIMLLDEIGAGVNRTLLGKIADKIKQLNEESGYTFCLIEHDLDFVSRLCHGVIVMAQGELLMTGTVDEVRRDERVIEAYFGGGRYQDAS
ncbi:MAG: ABC transporter ATP-binding protein [Hyphomicrobiales bacterium]|nr:ABC transporter ATP-binding protein [Hyphomicrobiales bacterium]MCP5001845.1 ABC transporter ATP-binding protein [Hyphomicrobiales bacterium]